MPKQTLDHLRSKKKPVSKSVWISGDADLVQQVEEANKKLALARGQQQMRPNSEEIKTAVAALEAEVTTIEASLKESSVKFRLQSIGRKNWEKLVLEHPATETEKKRHLEQLAEQKELGVDISNADTDLQWSPDTFPVALIAASTIEPDANIEVLTEWLSGDDWNESELLMLFKEALEVNIGSHLVRLGKG